MCLLIIFVSSLCSLLMAVLLPMKGVAMYYAKLFVVQHFLHKN